MTKHVLKTSDRSNRLAAYAVSASLLAVAASNWSRPGPVNAQAPDGDRVRMSAQSQATLNALEDAFVTLADRMAPSVVTISARRPAPAALPGQPAPRPRAGTGSGVIIREQGSTVYVLTNNHVVGSTGGEYRIQLADQSEYPAEVVGTDSMTDLAVLRFQARQPLPAGSVARFGDASRVRVGQWAVAIGSPLGYRSTFTVGVISAKGRTLGGQRDNALADLIQTDASINPGNSGGPLMNINGEVVGINVAIASNGPTAGNIGIGFAIPSDTAQLVATQLMSSGKVARGFLGVQVSSENRVLKPELREQLGVPNGGALIEKVSPGTPASEAGIRDGDVIVRLGDRAIRSFTDLEKAILATPPGTTVNVSLIRAREPLSVSLRTQARPEEVAAAPQP